MATYSKVKPEIFKMNRDPSESKISRLSMVVYPSRPGLRQTLLEITFLILLINMGKSMTEY